MNPLFSGHGGKAKRSPFYASASNQSGQKQTNINLTGYIAGRTETGDGVSSPAPSKKPRISLEPDPFDDFPEEDFTAGDLEAMELMASQAMTLTNQNDLMAINQGSKGAGIGAEPSRATGGFTAVTDKPVGSSLSQTAGSTSTHPNHSKTSIKQTNVGYISSGKFPSQRGTQVAATPTQTLPLRNLPATGIMGSGSRVPPYQSNIDFQVAPTSRPKDTNASVAPGAKHPGHLSGQFVKKLGGTAGNVLTPPAGSLARESSTLPVGQDGRRSPSVLQQEIDKLASECANYQKQLTSILEERYKKDGEIKMLRDKVQQTSSELSKVKMEKFNFSEEQKRVQTKKEKELLKEIENMKTQLQFKEMEIVDIQSKNKSLERKLKHSESSSNAPPKGSPRKHGSHHHHRADRQPSSSPGKSRDSFPTRKSFLAHGGPSTPPRSPKLQSLRMESPMAERGPKSPGQSGSPRRRDSGAYALEARQTKLPTVGKIDMAFSRGLCSSSQLVSKLLCINRSTSYSGEISNQGLITLLQLPAMQPTHQASAEDCGIAAALKAPRSSAVSSPERWSPVGMTSRENHRGALQTLSTMLSKSQTSNAETATELPACCRSNTVGLLPVIQDHLVKYIDVLHSIAEPAFSGSTATSRSSDSHHTDAGSSRSSECENWVFSQTEKATLNALAVLQRLVCNSCCVRTALLKSSPDHITGSISTIPAQSRKTGIHNQGSVSAMEIDPSAPLIPDTQAPTQNARKHVTALVVAKTRDSSITQCLLTDVPVNSILTKVLRIASIHNMYGQSSAMLQATLNVLLAIAENSEPALLDRLQPVLTDGTLQNCLSPDNSYNIVSTTIAILSVTVHNKIIALSLCNQSESCTLLRLYQLCASGVEETTEQEWTVLQLKILQFLSTLFSCHHGSVALLVESDCDCSVEVVKAVILMLCREYHVFCKVDSDEQLTSLSLQVLRQGVLLLHYLCIYDKLFISHRVEVESYYVKIISALSALYKELPDITEHEATAIQELWDFEQPDEIWSPEGYDDDELQMETD